MPRERKPQFFVVAGTNPVVHGPFKTEKAARKWAGREFKSFCNFMIERIQWHGSVGSFFANPQSSIHDR
jgi:hypothetical protein